MAVVGRRQGKGRWEEVERRETFSGDRVTDMGRRERGLEEDSRFVA